MVFYGVMLYDVVMFLKGMGHTPTTCRNAKILGVMFPFGAIGAWSKAQRAKWQALSTSCGGHSGYTYLSASFHVFQRNNFCSAPFRLSFYCWKSFTTRGPILNPTKTENEFPSKGKPQIPEKTSQQWRLKTYTDHTRTESFMKTSTEDFDNFLMTSTGHSDASVCERLSSCAPGATATLDLGRPMQVLLSKRPKKSRNKNRMQ